MSLVEWGVDALTSAAFFVISRRIPMIVPTTTFQSKEIRKAGSRRFIGKSDKAIRAMDSIESALLMAEPPLSPIADPVILSVRFSWHRPKSHAKHLRDKWAYRETKPDLDNVTKGFVDALVDSGYLAEDARVVKFDPDEKVWAPDGVFVGVEFRITPAPEFPGLWPFADDLRGWD